MSRYLWGMVALLLLAAIQTIPRLNYDAFSNDELRSVIVAGGAHHGPLPYPGGVWARVAEQSPDQALGFPLLIALWGSLTGWSELATRTLPLLAGLLTIALTYRIGREWLTPPVGISAAAILATSIYFLTFMHKFRVFTLAALALALTLWSYYRLIRTDHPPRWRAMLAFVVGGVALTYTHYFVTPFLAVLGLYHLLFAPKTRRWWLPALLILPVIVIFLPELNVLIDGFAMNQTRTDLQESALAPLPLIAHTAHFFGNGFGWLLIPPLILSLWQLRDPRHRPARHLIIFSAVGMFVMLVVVNELSGVLVARRVRYLMGMWVPLALWVASTVYRPAPIHPRLSFAPALILIWALIGVGVTTQDRLMTFTVGDQIEPLPLREYAAAIHAGWVDGDAEIFFGDDVPAHGHYTHGIPRRTIVPPYWGADVMQTGIDGALRVWWGINQREQQDDNLAQFQAILASAGYTPCESIIEHRLLTLTLYAASPAFCSSDAQIAAYPPHITLSQLALTHTNDQLTLNTGWHIAPNTPPNTYSVGFHLLDHSGALVRQSDVSLGAAIGRYVPLRTALNTTALPAGTYTLTVLVYAWETGERLGEPVAITTLTIN